MSTDQRFRAWWDEFARRLRADLSDETREAVRTNCYLAFAAGAGEPIPMPPVAGEPR